MLIAGLLSLLQWVFGLLVPLALIGGIWALSAGNTKRGWELVWGSGANAAAWLLLGLIGAGVNALLCKVVAEPNKPREQLTLGGWLWEISNLVPACETLGRRRRREAHLIAENHGELLLEVERLERMVEIQEKLLAARAEYSVRSDKVREMVYAYGYGPMNAAERLLDLLDEYPDFDDGLTDNLSPEVRRRLERALRVLHAADLKRGSE